MESGPGWQQQAAAPEQSGQQHAASLALGGDAKSVEMAAACRQTATTPAKMALNQSMGTYFFSLALASSSFFKNFFGFLSKSFLQDLQQSLISCPS